MADYENYGLRYEGPKVQNYRKNVSTNESAAYGNIIGSPEDMKRYLNDMKAGKLPDNYNPSYNKKENTGD